MNNLTFAEAHFSAHEKRVEDALTAQRSAWPKDPLTNVDALAMLVADILLYCEDKKIEEGQMLAAGYEEYRRRKARGVTA